MRNLTRRGEGELATVIAILFGLFVILGGIGGCMSVWPRYKVWEQEKEGEAEMAKANANRQIKVREAEASKEAAKHLAEAEVIRAEGVAKANKIIGDSLANNELYLHYLWIQNLHEGRNDVIYIPTEAGIPIMEAGRNVRRKAEAKTPEKP
jgi:hypothetical protein